MQRTRVACYCLFQGNRNAHRCRRRPVVAASAWQLRGMVQVKLLHRIAPALLLMLLAPVIAEFLLGDFTVLALPLILVLGWQYAGGALFIRELARQLPRGWPTMLFLALAYGLIEEGFTTQSLFNPNSVGQRLLDYGFLPMLGTS